MMFDKSLAERENPIQIPDLQRSFLTFRIDADKKPLITVSHPPPYALNNARIQLESRCLITDRESGTKTEYVHGVSCKTEQVGAPRDIWLVPNADFCPILSTEHFFYLKSWDRIGRGAKLYPPGSGEQTERNLESVEAAFDSVKFTLRMTEADALATPGEIVEATLNDDLLAGRVEFTAQERYQVLIDFPIKTMNANERDIIYQTDTGPILFPDFSVAFAHPVETFYLAFVALNSPGWAEFILQVPTNLTETIAVNHYAKTIHLESHNTIYRLRSSG